MSLHVHNEREFNCDGMARDHRCMEREFCDEGYPPGWLYQGDLSVCSEQCARTLPAPILAWQVAPGTPRPRYADPPPVTKELIIHARHVESRHTWCGRRIESDPTVKLGLGGSAMYDGKRIAAAGSSLTCQRCKRAIKNNIPPGRLPVREMLLNPDVAAAFETLRSHAFTPVDYAAAWKDAVSSASASTSPEDEAEAENPEGKT